MVEVLTHAGTIVYAPVEAYRAHPSGDPIPDAWVAL
jgi:hypothetical protein